MQPNHNNGFLDIYADWNTFSKECKVSSSGMTGSSGVPRRHVATTEEKIQQEFIEMKKREEELK